MTTSQLTNFIALSIDFLPRSAGIGLLNAYFDGKQIGFADESAYVIDGSETFYYFPIDAKPGTHILSIRLDDLSTGSTAVAVREISTGYTKLVRPGDIDGNGQVDTDDLLVFIGSWGPCLSAPSACPADIHPPSEGDGQVNTDDLLLLLGNWTS